VALAFRRTAIIAGLAAIVAAAFWQRWHVLGATPFPVGIDGYFYPIQVRSLLEHGTLRYPASPVTFYWMLPFAAATDPITGAKIAAALGSALIAVPAYGVGARFGGAPGSWAARTAGFVAAVLAATSASSGYLAIEFVKQGIGLTVAVAALWAILRALEPHCDPAVPSARIGGAHVFAWWRVTLAVLAVIAVFATHKLAAALVLVVAAPAVIVRVRHELRGRRLIFAMLIGSALVIAFMVAGLVAPQRFVSPHDLALLRSLVTATPHPGAPALVMPDGHQLVFAHEALLGGIAGVLAIGVLLVDRRRAQPRLSRELRIAGFVIAGLGVAIAIPWLAVTDPQGLGFRLRIAAYVPLALGAAICTGELARQVARRAGEHTVPVLAAFALLLFAIEVPQDRTEGEVLTHPALAAAAAAAYGRIPAGATVIVPERHILFMVDWYTRASVSLRPEPIPRRYRVRLFGLVFIGGPGSPLDRALDAARTDRGVEPPLGLHPSYRNGLVLVTEPTWSWLLGHLPDRERAHFAAWPTI
jgi:hypothetical protein